MSEDTGQYKRSTAVIYIRKRFLVVQSILFISLVIVILAYWYSSIQSTENLFSWIIIIIIFLTLAFVSSIVAALKAGESNEGT